MIRIRASKRQRDLIDQAARITNKTRSEFIRDAATREAENVLLDQAYFRISEEAFAELTAFLDTPPEPTPALRELLNARPPWDQ